MRQGTPSTEPQSTLPRMVATTGVGGLPDLAVAPATQQADELVVRDVSRQACFAISAPGPPTAGAGSAAALKLRPPYPTSVLSTSRGDPCRPATAPPLPYPFSRTRWVTLPEPDRPQYLVEEDANPLPEFV